MASTRRQVNWFNLSNGRIERLCEMPLKCPKMNVEERNRLSQETALVRYKRKLASDESYWFQ